MRVQDDVISSVTNGSIAPQLDIPVERIFEWWAKPPNLAQRSVNRIKQPHRNQAAVYEPYHWTGAKDVHHQDQNKGPKPSGPTFFGRIRVHPSIVFCFRRLSAHRAHGPYDLLRRIST